MTMIPENPKNKRLLYRDDIAIGHEFTLAQTTSVTNNHGGDSRLRVGDVIRIERCSSEGFYISINGHLKGSDALWVSKDELPNFVIMEE